jgi:O-antigen/teichoic acid export membrane protein
MIRWLKNRIFKSEFNKNVAKLVSGTASANLITVLFLPILTRLYSIDAFGHFQLLLSVSLILTVISTLKYEMTIPLSKSKVDSDSLFVVSIINLIGLSFVTFILIHFFGESILSIYDATHLSEYRWWISLAVFSAGGFELMNYVYMNNKAFGLIAKYRILQVGLIQSVSLAYGLIYPSFMGLLIAYLFGNGFVTLLMLFKSNISIRSVNIKYAIRLAYKYKKFPLINAPMALINTFSMQLPVFMLSAYFSPEVVGFYMIANKMITMPLNLISRSVGRVYYQSASSAIHKGKHVLLRTFRQSVLRVAKLGFIPALFILFFAPSIVTFVLGDHWEQAGIFMQIMIPWLFFQFVNLPIATTFSIVKRQEIGFLLIVISIISRLLVMNYWHQTPQELLFFLTIISTLFYIAYIWFSYTSIMRTRNFGYDK